MDEQRRQQRLKLMKKAARYKMRRLEAALGGSFDEYMEDRAQPRKRSHTHSPPNAPKTR